MAQAIDPTTGSPGPGSTVPDPYKGHITASFQAWDGKTYFMDLTTGQILRQNNNNPIGTFSEAQASYVARNMGLNWDAIAKLDNASKAQVYFALWSASDGAGTMFGQPYNGSQPTNTTTGMQMEALTNWIKTQGQSGGWYTPPGSGTPTAPADTHDWSNTAYTWTTLDQFGITADDLKLFTAYQQEQLRTMLAQFVKGVADKDWNATQEAWGYIDNAAAQLPTLRRTNPGTTPPPGSTTPPPLTGAGGRTGVDALGNRTADSWGIDFNLAVWNNQTAYVEGIRQAMAIIADARNQNYDAVIAAMTTLDKAAALQRGFQGQQGNYRPGAYSDWNISEELIPEAYRATYARYLETIRTAAIGSDEYNAAIQGMMSAPRSWQAPITGPSAPPTTNPNPDNPPANDNPFNPQDFLDEWRRSYEETMRQIGEQIAGALGTQNEAPTSAPPPDPMDTDILQAMRRQKEAVMQRAGYRSTFVTGPRGIGGPTTQEWANQLSQTPNDLSAVGGADPTAATGTPDSGNIPTAPEEYANVAAPSIGERDPRGYVNLDKNNQLTPNTSFGEQSDVPGGLPDPSTYSPKRRQYW